MMIRDVLLDSNVMIEFLRGDQGIRERLATMIAEKSRICFCAISSAELCAGMRPGEDKKAAAFFAALECLPIVHEVGVKAGEYLRRYGKSHHVELADALVAATAVLNSVLLWTLNRKHYPMPDVQHLES